jgi:hypothetical protein
MTRPAREKLESEAIDQMSREKFPRQVHFESRNWLDQVASKSFHSFFCRFHSNSLPLFVPQSAFFRAQIEKHDKEEEQKRLSGCKEKCLMKGNQGNDKNTFETKICAARTSKPPTSLELSEL